MFTFALCLFGFQADLLGLSGVVPKNMLGLLGIKPSFAKNDRFQQFKQAWNLHIPHKKFTVNSLSL